SFSLPLLLSLLPPFLPHPHLPHPPHPPPPLSLLLLLLSFSPPTPPHPLQRGRHAQSGRRSRRRRKLGGRARPRRGALLRDPLSPTGGRPSARPRERPRQPRGRHALGRALVRQPRRRAGRMR